MKPNYYAVIPASVRYSDLPANAKLLYGEIAALCNREGFCWATDSYFAELYGVSKKAIQSWLKSLEEFGYIAREVKYKKGSKQVEQRKITLHPIHQKVRGYTPKGEGGMHQKVRENNTSINNTYNTLTKVKGRNADYGNNDINEMFAYWQERTGIEITGRKQANRRACYNLIKKHGVQKLKRLVDGVALAQTESYAPTIADFDELQSKQNKLIAWGKKRAADNKSRVMEI